MSLYCLEHCKSADAPTTSTRQPSFSTSYDKVRSIRRKESIEFTPKIFKPGEKRSLGQKPNKLEEWVQVRNSLWKWRDKDARF